MFWIVKLKLWTNNWPTLHLIKTCTQFYKTHRSSLNWSDTIYKSHQDGLDRMAIIYKAIKTLIQWWTAPRPSMNRKIEMQNPYHKNIKTSKKSQYKTKPRVITITTCWNLNLNAWFSKSPLHTTNTKPSILWNCTTVSEQAKNRRNKIFVVQRYLSPVIFG